MPEDNQTSDDSGEVNKKDESASHATVRAKSSGLQWIIIGGCVATAALLYISIYFPNMTERVKFFISSFLSLLVLMVIILQAIIYKRQAGYMRDQWKAMNIQAGTMEQQLAAMRDSLEETRKMGDQNERAVRAAERNIEIIQESTIYAQRAYVSVTRGEVAGDMFFLVIENSGHTPANDVEIGAIAEIREQPPDPETSSIRWATMGVIAPDEYIKRMVVRRGEATPEMRELVNDGKMQFYCSGIIRYTDIFKNPRQTKFCFYQRFGTNQFGPCATGNEAD